MDGQRILPVFTELLAPAEAQAQYGACVHHNDDAQTHNDGIPGLLRMPAELIELITEFLPVEEFRQFRLVNRHLNDVSFDVFGTRFFSWYGIRLVFDELERLNQIVEHPILGKKITDLMIRSEYKLPVDVFNSPAAEWFDTLPRKGKQLRLATESWCRFQERFINRREHHKHMRSSGLASLHLARALEKLESLEVLGTVHESWYQEDELKQMWKDSRAPELESRYDFAPESWEEWNDRPLVPSCDLDIIVSAVNASGIKIPNLTFYDGTFLVKRKTPRSDGPEALLLQNCLRSLKRLDLSPTFTSRSDVDYIPWVLSTAPETLETLNVMVDDMRSEERSVPFYKEIFKIRRFKDLTEIIFQFPVYTLSYLVQFVREHKTSLKSCKLMCLDRHWCWDSRGTKWSQLAKACLEVQNLDQLFLLTRSSLYVSEEHPERFSGIGAIMELSKTVPGRTRVEEELARWEALERAAGL
ncbi:hypothetical protein HDK90DRAFT_7146 [Phyllosticta capitalensis]|uniref:F-box domain-containing protein n=1 Tax=Phyllosticta capitalensis TaxID=121624 RepID=A0ABR1Z2N5_9PEZI